jgi:hypothetical protein
MKNVFTLMLLLASCQAFAEPAATSNEPAASSYLKIDAGQAKLNLLLQMWDVNDSIAVGAKNNFRARRAEIKLSGNLRSDARWFVMIDPAKSLRTGAIASTNDNKILQDLGIAYQPIAGLELTAGQFKIPTTAEGLDSSGDLPLPERSLVGRTFGDKRQLGFQAAYQAGLAKITAMVSNTGSANVDDTTTRKDFNFRLEVSPISGLGLGSWVGATDMKFGDNGKWGVNARWKGAREQIRFEYGNGRETTAGVKVRSNGYMAEAAYAILPELQPVVRYERFQPTVASSLKAQASTIGLNYLFQKNNHKIQAGYTAMQRIRGSNGSYSADTTAGKGKLFIVSFQMAI